MTLHSPPPTSAICNAGYRGRRVRRALEAEHARPREVVQVVPGALRQRSGLPVAGERADDEARVRGEQRRVRHAEPVEDPRPELLDEHVVAPRERQERLAPRRLLQIEAGAALVAVQREEDRRRVPACAAACAAGSRPLRVLELVDLGPEVAEHHRRERPRQEARPVEDLDPRERLQRRPTLT